MTTETKREPRVWWLILTIAGVVYGVRTTEGRAKQCVDDMNGPDPGNGYTYVHVREVLEVGDGDT